MDKQKSFIRNILFGVAVGDALGVPVEFKTRKFIQQNPVTNMIGYGTHNVPPGTWSDDSSMTFCLAEALLHEFNLQTIADNFIAWYYEGLWTPFGTVFDIGFTTRMAIARLKNGEQPDLAGSFESDSNGNGSLMRVLPLLIYIRDKPIEERYDITKKVCSITHGHIRSAIACFYYLEFARCLLNGDDKFSIYQKLKSSVTDFLNSIQINSYEIALFERLLQKDIYMLDESEIKSSGYVLHTLEASIWCLLITNNYRDAVLKAVNLGEDTDTTGAITGGLASLLYGHENIPENWLSQLARKNDINLLAEKLNSKYFNQ